MAAPAETIVDLYGFPVKVYAPQVKERADCDAAVEREQLSWMPYIEKERLPNSESKTKDMIRKGVPPTLRSWVWMQTSGAAKKKATHAESYYQIMVKAGGESPHLKDIEQDCPRTFPEHPWLSGADGQAALMRVLQAYSMHNVRVGYCRAMNNVVAMMLIALNRNEESAFWLLAALVEDILFQGTYAHNLEGCQVEMRALDELISQKLPRLHAHLQAIDFDISMIATDWYLCLFSVSMPSETCTRVWDSLFCEGPKILFRVALALLKLYEEKILSVNDAGELMMRMRNAAATMHQRDVLMTTAFDGIGSLPMASIEKFRELKQLEVEAVLASRGARSEIPAAASTSGGGAHAGVDKAAEVMKVGFGKFMTGMTKLAEKTAEQMSKLNTKDDPAAAGASQHHSGAAPVSSGGAGAPPPPAPPAAAAPAQPFL